MVSTTSFVFCLAQSLYVCHVLYTTGKPIKHLSNGISITLTGYKLSKSLALGSNFECGSGQVQANLYELLNLYGCCFKV